MTKKNINKKPTKALLLFIFLIFTVLSFSALAENSKDDDDNKKEPESPCTSLISLIDRPSFADSPCTVPMDHALFEFGLLGFTLNKADYGISVPQPTVRIGLTNTTEFLWIVPSYIRITGPTLSGFRATAVGIKQELAHSKKWIATVEGIVIPPSGSANFGSAGYGGIINGIFSYNLTSQLNVLIQLSGSNVTESERENGERVKSFNQSYVLGWQPQEKVQLYAEVFGQSRTGHDEGSGYVTDAGILYLVNKNFLVDFEVGRKIYGNVAGIDKLIGMGFAFYI